MDKLRRLLFEGKANWSVPVALLVTSGGIGFLFSTIHHALHRDVYPLILPWSTVDHRPTLISLADRLSLVDQEENQVNPNQLTRAGAWRVVTAIWHERRETSDRLRSANQRTVELFDHAHAAGTALVASVAAMVIWISIHSIIGSPERSGMGFLELRRFPGWEHWLVPLGICVVHLGNFHAAARHAQGVVDMILSNELRSRWWADVVVGGPDIIGQRIAPRAWQGVTAFLRQVLSGLTRNGWRRVVTLSAFAIAFLLWLSGPMSFSTLLVAIIFFVLGSTVQIGRRS